MLETEESNSSPPDPASGSSMLRSSIRWRVAVISAVGSSQASNSVSLASLRNGLPADDVSVSPEDTTTSRSWATSQPGEEAAMTRSKSSSSSSRHRSYASSRSGSCTPRSGVGTSMTSCPWSTSSVSRRSREVRSSGGAAFDPTIVTLMSLRLRLRRLDPRETGSMPRRCRSEHARGVVARPRLDLRDCRPFEVRIVDSLGHRGMALHRADSPLDRSNEAVHPHGRDCSHQTVTSIVTASAKSVHAMPSCTTDATSR